MSYADIVQADRRLMILRALAATSGYGANRTLIRQFLDSEGHAVSRDLVDTEVTWIPAAGGSRLAALVETIEWPDGPGYFWMAGESAQMREIRRYVRRSLGWGSDRHDLMGYWSATRPRQTRAIDPGPIYARGKAAGKSDEEIWAEYDELRAGQ